MGLVTSTKGLRQIVLPCRNRKELLLKVEGEYKEAESKDSSFGDLPARLQTYLSGKHVDFIDELDLSKATTFQKEVWRVARTIPYGETRSYGWISTQLGYRQKAARAVGNALGRNPLPILIPCHRVLHADGGLGGFSAGLKLKQFLLRLES